MGLIVHCTESICFDYAAESIANHSESLPFNRTSLGALGARNHIRVSCAANRCAGCPCAARCWLRADAILIHDERSGLTAPAGMGGGVILDLTSTQKTQIRYQFESFCKKVIHSERCDYLRQLQRRSEHEVPFSDLPSAMLDGFVAACSDDVDICVFEVFGYRIPIRNDKLAEALLNLGAEGYSILLLAYSLELSDREIGEMLGLSRSSIQRTRTSLLGNLKNNMIKE